MADSVLPAPLSPLSGAAQELVMHSRSSRRGRSIYIKKHSPDDDALVLGHGKEVGVAGVGNGEDVRRIAVPRDIAVAPGMLVAVDRQPLERVDGNKDVADKRLCILETEEGGR